MARFNHTVFVCTHQRDPAAADPRGDCTQRGSAALLAAWKLRSKAPPWRGRIRVVASGCLDLCRQGCAAVVFCAPGRGPAERWLTRLDPAAADHLFDRHVVGAAGEGTDV